ncbi:MAG: hypothetical protein FJ221_18250 [Lentisphaerae bacterium]|nr:hypothetical protein [Lentisphaerota bacterium]
MRYAIVSDIHANWQAWSAVRDDIRKRRADTMVCLGDIVGYGPSPARVFADLEANCGNFVLGNHDAAAAGDLDTSIFNENARRSTVWTAAQLDRETLRRLGSAPMVLDAEDILFVHAETPAPDEFGYVETAEDARACFGATDARFIFVGHTHVPLVFALRPDGTIETTSPPVTVAEKGSRYLVTVGSVGNPGDGTDKASYCIFDSATGTIGLKKVAFDVAAFRAELDRVPELALPWFLRQHKVDAARPADDLAVAAGSVARTRIRVTSSRARIRVKASALAPRAGEPAKAPQARRRRTGLVLSLIGAVTVVALAGVYFALRRGTPPPPTVADAPTAAPSPPSGATPPSVLPAFRAVASGEEYKSGHTNLALMAIDGDPATRWCSGDGLAEHWLQINLGRALPLGGLRIAWEHPDLAYGFKIEGSRNARTWALLAEGRGTSADLIAITSAFAYVRITVMTLPEKKWASIAEVTFFDADGREIRVAPPVIEASAAPPVVEAAATAPDVRPPAAMPSTGGATAKPPEGPDSLARIAEAKDYTLVYDLDLAKLGATVSYEADNTAAAPRFDRVAYLIELKKANAPANFLWVSMDAFTTEAAKLGVPVSGSGAVFQQTVENLTVITDVDGIATGERIGPGNIEFWPSNYGTKNPAGVPGASDTDYDFGDAPSNPQDGYGSMQVHHTAAKQTLFAVNNWRKGGAGADIGIGNSDSKGKARNTRCFDWTFSGSGGTYSDKRLRVFVHPAP